MAILKSFWLILFKIRIQDCVTGVSFIYRGLQRFLVSVSKDTLLKVITDDKVFKNTGH